MLRRVGKGARLRRAHHFQSWRDGGHAQRGRAFARPVGFAHPTAADLDLHGEIPYICNGRPIMPSIRKKPAPPKKRASPQRELKTQRLELRLAPSAKRVIHLAMSVTGLAAGDLAYEGARR